MQVGSVTTPFGRLPMKDLSKLAAANFPQAGIHEHRAGGNNRISAIFRSNVFGRYLSLKLCVSTGELVEVGRGQLSFCLRNPCFQAFLAGLPNRVILQTIFYHLSVKKRIGKEMAMLQENSEFRDKQSSDARIAHHAKRLSEQLQTLSERMFPPTAQKALKTFSSTEAAVLVGVSDGFLRALSIEGKGPSPDLSDTGRRSYTLSQVNELREYMAAAKPKDAVSYLPRRRAGEKLQTIAVANFKGGSAKTTTTIYLAQYLALQGYRVLAVDLDPQASLTSLFGIQPEFDLSDGDTLYGAIRYDEKQRPLKDIIRKTYFDGLDLVPGNLELMEFEHDTPTAIHQRQTGAHDIFFKRVGLALASVEEDYDIVVIDCPPQLGYLTLGAVCAATSLLITIHPQMVDVASMSQFLLMTSDLMSVVRDFGGELNHDFIRYVVTRHEPNDGPQAQIVGMLRSLFAEEVLTSTAVKSTAIADAGLTKQTLYELPRGQITRKTYDRAVEAIDSVNGEILAEIQKVWGRS